MKDDPFFDPETMYRAPGTSATYLRPKCWNCTYFDASEDGPFERVMHHCRISKHRALPGWTKAVKGTHLTEHNNCCDFHEPSED